MKITKAKLKQIIKEELSALSEAWMHSTDQDDWRGTSQEISTDVEGLPPEGELGGIEGGEGHDEEFVAYGNQIADKLLAQLPNLYDAYKMNVSADEYVNNLEVSEKLSMVAPDPDSPYHPDSPGYKG